MRPANRPSPSTSRGMATQPRSCTWRLFELGLGPIALALCGASDPASQRRIETVLAEHGGGAFAARFLADCDLGWAADLLADFPAPRPSSPQGEAA